MATRTQISEVEYLSTSYHPDAEYVDGVLVERNTGEWPHSLVQRNIVVAFFVKYPQVFAVPEFRTKTRETRYRIPDVCVLLAPPKTKVLLESAFVAIEILSDDDRMSRVIERLKEFEAKGTPNIWIIEPNQRQIFTFRSGDLLEVKSDTIATGNPRLELTRTEIFKDLD